MTKSDSASGNPLESDPLKSIGDTPTKSNLYSAGVVP